MEPQLGYQQAKSDKDAYREFKFNWTSVFCWHPYAGCTYQSETSAGNEHFKARVDKEGHQPRTGMSASCAHSH